MPGKEGLLKTFLQTSGGSQMLSATLALLGRTFSANLALIGAEHWKILVLYPAVWHYRSARVSQATLCCIRPSIFQFSLCPGCTCPILFCFICKEWIQEEKNILPTPFFHSIFCLFGLVILVLQPGIYGSLAHPTPIQNALKRSHLWVPSVDIFPKDLVKWH